MLLCYVNRKMILRRSKAFSHVLWITSLPLIIKALRSKGNAVGIDYQPHYVIY